MPETYKHHVREHLRLVERTPLKILHAEEHNHREAYRELAREYHTAVTQLGWAIRDLLHAYQVLGIDRDCAPSPCTPFLPAEAACEVES